MATNYAENGGTGRGPGPLSLILASVAVMAVVALGVWVLMMRTSTPRPGTVTVTAPVAVAASSSAPAVASPTGAPAAGEPSVCGLTSVQLDGTLATPPQAQWIYDGNMAYASIPQHGPARDDNGVRSCFSHTPTGALLASANAAAEGSNPKEAPAWLRYVLADGPNRDSTLAQANTGDSSSGSSARVVIAGFKLLSYNGSTAQVDLAVRTSYSGQTVYAASVYTWKWEHGDWKLVVDGSTNPLHVQVIPDLSGYIAWGA